MHAYLVHANIMVSVIESCKGFNADAMEAIMDRPALVRIMPFQLMYSAISREIRVYTRAAFVPVSVNCDFDINKRARAHLYLYNNVSIISDCCTNTSQGFQCKSSGHDGRISSGVYCATPVCVICTFHRNKGACM